MREETAADLVTAELLPWHYTSFKNLQLSLKPHRQRVTEREREGCSERGRTEGKEECVTDRTRGGKKDSRVSSTEREQRNTRPKSIWSVYSVNIQYMSDQNLKNVTFSAAKKRS